MPQVFKRRTVMPVSPQALYDWHARPGAFERLNPVFDPVTIEERTGGLEVGASTRIRMNIGPVSQGWTAVHTACEPGVMFRDEQRGGPFKSWVHTHRFEAHPEGSVLDDTIEYELPAGGLGQLFGGRFAEGQLEKVFAYRHAITLADLTRHAAFSKQPRLKVAVTGASGLVGSALIPFLTTGGHTVVPVRRKGSEINALDLEGADAVVHLAGASIGDGRWNAERKKLLIDSRVAFTKQLVGTFKTLKHRPKVLISGSAIGIYGSRGDEWLTENSAPGPRGEAGAEFLSALTADWEAAGREAEALGTRVVLLRTGIVQSANGGALGKLLTPFKAGAGGPVGKGTQWQSWVSLEDLVGIIHIALMTDGMSGPINAVAPNPVTSREYASVLGSVLSRPAITPLPAFVLKAAMGEMADGLLLASQRVRSDVLQGQGFAFLHPTLQQALRFTLGK